MNRRVARRRRDELDRHPGFIAPAPPLNWSESQKSFAIGELLDAEGYLALITRSRVDWSRGQYDPHRIVAAFVIFDRMLGWAQGHGLVDEREYRTFCPFAQVITAVASFGSAGTTPGAPGLTFRPVQAWLREKGWDVGVFGRRFPSSEPAFHPVAEVLTTAEEWWSRLLQARRFGGRPEW